MLLGLGTLSQLRALCLPGTFGAADTQFDDALAAIGRGVSAQFDSLCNRRFARVEDETEEFEGGRCYLSASRYPIKSISAIAWREVVGIVPGEWSDATTAFRVNGTNFRAGLIGLYRGSEIGTYSGEQFRLTYTGGYFVADDPPAEGDPEPMPEGATALPEDLALAWQLQCAHVFEAANYFGTAAIRTPNAVTGKMPPLTQVEILPVVKATLDRYTRLSC